MGCILRMASFVCVSVLTIVQLLAPILLAEALPASTQLPRRARMHSNTKLASHYRKENAAFNLPWSRFRAVTVIHEPCSTMAYTLTNFAGNLGPDWPLLVMYTPRAEAAVFGSKAVRYLARYGGLATLPLSALGMHGLADLVDVTQYSRLLARPEFWEAMRAEKVLIFQVDSVLCSGSEFTVDDFLAYDYIGAPWIDEGQGVGNGGLSMRSVNRMLNITRHFNQSVHPEDVYFAKGLAAMAQLDESIVRAPSSVAGRFSWERGSQPPGFVPFGIHRSDLVPKQMKPAVTRGCPEAAIGVWSSCGRAVEEEDSR